MTSSRPSLLQTRLAPTILSRRLATRRLYALGVDYITEQATSLESIQERQTLATSTFSEVVPFEGKADVLEGQSWVGPKLSPQIEIFSKKKQKHEESTNIVKGRRSRRNTSSNETETLQPPTISQSEILTSSPEEQTLLILERQLMTKSLDSNVTLSVESKSNGRGNQSSPLLTRSQEIILSEMIQKAVPLIEQQKRLKKEAGVNPSIDDLAKECNKNPDEAREILERAGRAKHLMIQYNVGLVHYCAKMLQDRSPPGTYGLLVLTGMGSRGLERAVMKYDPSVGPRFAAYAIYWIRQAMENSIAHDHEAIYIPSCARAIINKINAAKRKLMPSNVMIDVKAIAEESELSEKIVRKYIGVSKKPISLEQTVYKGKDGDEVETLLDRLPAKQKDTWEMIHDDEVREIIDLSLSILDEREREIMTLRYGLDGGPCMEFTAIARKYGLSSERIRQIDKSAIRKLRKIMHSTPAAAELIFQRFL